MHTFELLLILVAASVALAYAAQRLRVPLAVALVLGGIALAFVPGVGMVTLDPELVLALFLPPLLQASAYRTDWPAFRFNLRPILSLALGAVFFTAAAVAIVAKLLVPGLPWWAAITLGAIVAPPDAVAAAAILKQVKLPKRIVTVLEGESLINDASSLVLYRCAVAATLAGTFRLGEGVFQFFAAAIGGTLAGWLVGRAAMWIFVHLEDTLLDITVSLLAGFFAYFLAEQVHVSGVLAAVGCGLVLGRRQHAAFTGETRLGMATVWGFVEFLLTALVFMLIGLQLRGIVERLEGYDAKSLSLIAVAISATLIVSRFVWIFPATLLPRMLSRTTREADRMPPWSYPTILSWAGMRGVVSLATALALPARFPGRDIIVFLAFCAIFATLVLQGTTLGWVIRRLGLEQEETTLPEPDTAQARAELASASLDAVQEHLDNDASEHGEAAAELVEEYKVRADRASIEGQDVETKTDQLIAQQRLRLVAIEAARETLMEQTDQIDAEAHRALGEELDLEERQIHRALGEA
ncbi:Na+/H+ antiporter [Sphingomonas sp. STIS6.2]|uniref:Na+/H+ antiporter n=1 Tax=Sphingomonas sp. STIS6.2 TaxID=1379700 RepID=UPI0004DB8841|nr:Na+/H+ antiporter [Sphingomonas sp. STIS6.2]